ncbi:MAG TPA: hypothetical protein VFG81_20990 [Anaerolineales bacterium]|jgi:hypothetical protein|nr:hypothetical protein [Anaerolineales bacterium]
MKNTVIESKWGEFRRNVVNWFNYRRDDQLTKVNNVRERSLSILQKRYGYTREEAISQLEKHYSRAWLG